MFVCKLVCDPNSKLNAWIDFKTLCKQVIWRQILVKFVYRQNRFKIAAI